jgi:protein gp37
MFSEKTRYNQDPNMVIRSSESTFNSPLKWARNPAKYGYIKRIFVDSWSDFFIEEADPWRDEAWDIMRKTPQFIYQLCTKRPERISYCLPSDWGGGYENVWLLTSTENQEAANKRIPLIMRVPAVVHGISAEPLLGGIHIESWLHPPSGLDWVIVGGESGANARPMLSQWAGSIQHQCEAAGVAFFFKQNGEWVDAGHEEFGRMPTAELRYLKSDGSEWGDFVPSDEDADVNTVKRVGRRRAVDTLYGKVYHEFPVTP